MKFAIVALVASTSAVELMSENMYGFMQFVGEHGKSYATKAEFDFRFNLFEQRVAEHKRWNAMPNQTSTQGVNFLTDYTTEELSKMLGYRQDMNVALGEARKNYVYEDVSAVAPIDWRAKGGVTPVKNQGSCGSCWSFSTTGALEGAHFNAVGKLVSLSESQFVNCDKTCHGCEGGLMDLAFKYAETHPVMTEEQWPYEPHSEPFSCWLKYKSSKGVTSVKSYKDVPASNPDQLKAFLMNGPVSVAIEADKAAFQQYTGGVLSGDACGTQLDHGVLAVGWGTDASAGDYIIVKNSWGPKWGVAGFIKLASAAGKGTCGINQSASQPTTD